ncbi:MAG TPA: hypothetical protein VKQ32_02615 [Polyangia bacterium]|nr:hypothetical protein [Polyangia bacterium]
MRHATGTAVALVWLASCGGSLGKGTGQAGNGGGTISTGLGGQGAGGAAGSAGGGSGECPRAPATNDPECHPEDEGLWAADLPVPALGGDCTPGLTCEIPVGVGNSCFQALGLQTYVCCPAAFANVTAGLMPPPPGGFVPGGTVDACPQPLPGQDPSCTLPLPSTCSVDGVICVYQATFGAGADAGCFSCTTHTYQVRCCLGVWTSGDGCPADAGMD